eukprot:TRINITY_DN17399_c0_g1_i1.p1 TRINITY_DN17399_c0_g1~~TRINITY_DN17399_c0_g1_i1.p1  ORF type:complete len:299 (-),score=53.22 TRINITY_DN17399_c0_g1_i1:118-1014(-)
MSLEGYKNVRGSYLEYQAIYNQLEEHHKDPTFDTTRSLQEQALNYYCQTYCDYHDNDPRSSSLLALPYGLLKEHLFASLGRRYHPNWFDIAKYVIFHKETPEVAPFCEAVKELLREYHRRPEVEEHCGYPAGRYKHWAWMFGYCLLEDREEALGMLLQASRGYYSDAQEGFMLGFHQWPCWELEGTLREIIKVWKESMGWGGTGLACSMEELMEKYWREGVCIWRDPEVRGTFEEQGVDYVRVGRRVFTERCVELMLLGYCLDADCTLKVLPVDVMRYLVKVVWEWGLIHWVIQQDFL